MDPRKEIRVFADDTRIRLVRVLAGQEFAVNELVEILQLAQSKISRHLGVLREAGILKDRSEGTWVYYTINEPGMGELPRRIWATLADCLDSADFYPEDLDRAQQVLEARKKRVRAYFDSVGAGWKAIRDCYLPADVSARTLACLIPDNLVVAEVGVGTGEMVMLLARAIRKVIAVDISSTMLTNLGRRVAELGLANVELREGDINELPIDSDTCDAVFASMVLHHVERPRRAIGELARVVRPAGRVVVCDLIRHEFDWVREAMADQWLGFDCEQMADWMRQAGLEDVRCEALAGDSEQARAAAPVGQFRAFLATGRKAMPHEQQT